MAAKRRIRFCQEGVYYTLVLLAVLVGATARQLNLLMLLGAALAGPLLFSLVYGRVALGRFSVRRILPDRLRADQRLVVDLVVTNSRRWLGAWSVQAEDGVVLEGGDSAARRSDVAVYLPRIEGGETKRVVYHGRLPRRGRYRFGPLRVTTRFPLGLIRHEVIVGEPATLLVHPSIGQLARDWGQLVREHASGAQRMRSGLAEADFYGLRDWRSGDSRRWIHWRTSARRGGLVVRQFEQRRSQDLALLVDLWQPDNPSQEQLDNVEQAISFVATLIAEACRQPGRQVSLAVAAASPLVRSGAATASFLRDQMDALALIEPHCQHGFPSMLGRSLAQVGHNVTALLLSTREVDARALAAAAEQHDAALAGKNLRTINVASGQLSPLFHV